MCGMTRVGAGVVGAEGAAVVGALVGVPAVGAAVGSRDGVAVRRRLQTPDDLR